MKTTISILCIYFMLFTGCSINDSPNKDQLTLPPITQMGENTFGCYINGNLLVPRSGRGTILGPDKGAVLWGDPSGKQEFTELDIFDFKSEKTANILIHIQNLDFNGKGDYIVDVSNGMKGIDGLKNNFIHCRVFDEATNRYQYYRSFENSGLVSITKYKLIPNESLIISGVFSCKVKNSINPNDIIEITEGRFDFNGATLPNIIFP